MMKPSERIEQIDQQLGCGRYHAICAYLDERETQLHPIARTQSRITDADQSAIDDATGFNDHFAPTSSPGDGIPLQYPLMHAAIERLEAETMTLTSERDTARMGQDEWRTRAEALAEAAYPVLAWLPRNDPGARMVAERLTVVLAGQAYEPEAARHFAETTEENCTVRLPYSDPLCAFREVTRWRDMQARTYEDGCKLLERFQALEQQHTETQTELTRLKEENARLIRGELAERAAMSAELRKRDAVVDVARQMRRAWGVTRAEAWLPELDAALSALDRTEGEQAEVPLEPPAPACDDCGFDYCGRINEPPAERPLGEEKP